MKVINYPIMNAGDYGHRLATDCLCRSLSGTAEQEAERVMACDKPCKYDPIVSVRACGTCEHFEEWEHPGMSFGDGFCGPRKEHGQKPEVAMHQFCMAWASAALPEEGPK